MMLCKVQVQAIGQFFYMYMYVQAFMYRGADTVIHVHACAE